MRNFLFVLCLLIVCCSIGYAQPYRFSNTQLEKTIESRISKMTLDQKITFIHGNTLFSAGGIDSLGIPSLRLSDGPHGVRAEQKPDRFESAGWSTDSSTYLPTLTALAATWNKELASKYGEVLGQEARYRCKDVILGPGVNIIRTPLCGRNFEYMSEDPYLISQLIVPYIKAVQKCDVAACVKHFAVNNQETDRYEIDVRVDERTLNEIYFPAFKAAVREGGVYTIMTAYNKFKGSYCSESTYLLDILKKQWGFEGIAISDWNGTHSTVKAANAGLDLEMGTNANSFNDYYFAKPLRDSVRSGAIKESVIDDKVRRILRVMYKLNVFGERAKGSFNTPEHRKAARAIAAESIVLLKNDGKLLPINLTKVKSIAVIGDNATRKHSEGGFSSAIKAIHEITPLEGINNYLRLYNKNVKINYAKGYEKKSSFDYSRGVNRIEDNSIDKKLINDAVVAAKNSDITVVFAGLNHDYDTEMLDKPDLFLPYGQEKLINALYNANANLIVVFVAGSPYSVEGIYDRVPAMLHVWYNGMEAGNAIADVLFGEVNPSGKLPFTFPKKLEDSPAHAHGSYPGENRTAKYDEGFLVGYRYYDTKKVEPRFCFGHGLSYTNFEYKDITISMDTMSISEILTVAFFLKNAGKVDGEETVQLYISDMASSVTRPLKELRDFRKISLPAGEEQIVSFKISLEDLSFYSIIQHRWIAEPGTFQISIGSSSRDIRLTSKFELK